MTATNLFSFAEGSSPWQNPAEKTNTKIPIVFTGISLSFAEARRIVSADVRPPVKRGDLDELRNDAIVAIIDGELHETILPTEEIRRAIGRGLHVKGASSLGALRAAELHQSGMGGLGWVYEAFCTGRIAGTDEIAVCYDPYSHRPLTIPLVNVRFCLARLVGNGSIAAGEAANAMMALSRIRVEQRDHRTVLLRLGEVLGRGRSESIVGMISDADNNIKARDAHRLLQSLKPRTACHADDLVGDFVCLDRKRLAISSAR
jgi:hypothetical protein